MKELISERIKKDISKLKDLKGRFMKRKKEEDKNKVKVLPPAKPSARAHKPAEGEPLLEKDVHEKTDEEQEQLQAGEIKGYAKELVYEVTNEEGNRIPCNTLAEAEILSGIIEIKTILRSLLEEK